MTFSLVAHDDRHIGVATASRSIAVGALVPWARAGVGVVATQAFTSPRLGPLGLAGLEAGAFPPKLLDALLAADPERELRQVALLDARANTANHTGSACVPAVATAAAPGVLALGNMLADPEVVEQMIATWTAAQGTLACRMVAALAAGEAAGGDVRGRQAAAMKVVERDGEYPPGEGVVADLRVDDHPEPLDELVRLLHVSVGSGRGNLSVCEAPITSSRTDNWR